MQNSLYMEVEELEQNNQISLSVERRRGTFGRLTVHWAASGSLADIYPSSGVVSKPESPHTKVILTNKQNCYQINNCRITMYRIKK